MKLAVAAMIAAAAAAPSAAEQRKLDMVAFFTGHSHADNVIKIAFHSPHKLIVDSIGGKGDRGDFVLVDTVREEGKPERTRKWVMRPAGPGHFTGTLSDAAGPVDMTVSGDSATIRYVFADGHLAITQQLKLDDEGRLLANHVTAKKFGIHFASVEGTIRKLD